VPVRLGGDHHPEFMVVVHPEGVAQAVQAAPVAAAAPAEAESAPEPVAEVEAEA